MRHLFRSLAVLAMLAACTKDPQSSGDAPQADDPAGRGATASEAPAPTPAHHEDARTRAILNRLKGPEEERPTNRR